MRCEHDRGSDGVDGRQEHIDCDGGGCGGSYGAIVFSAKPVGRIMLLEAAHTSYSSFDPAMVLFQSIVQIHTRPVAGIAAQS